MIWLDLVIVGVLLLGLGIGAKRGFLQTLGGVAAMVVSFVGAGIAAGAFSGTVAKWIRPVLEKKLESKGITGGSTAEMVEQAGFFGDTARRITDSVGTLVKETKETMVAAVTDGICDTDAAVQAPASDAEAGGKAAGAAHPEFGGRRRAGAGRGGIAGIFSCVGAAEIAAGHHGGYGAAVRFAAIFRGAVPYGLVHIAVNPKSIPGWGGRKNGGNYATYSLLKV